MNIIERVKNIIVTPKTEWLKIDTEEATLSSLLTGYVLPLTVIGAVAAFVGYAFIGIDTGVFGIKMKGMDWGLYTGIGKLVTGVLSFVIAAYVVDMLAPSFASEKNLNKSAQLVAYGTTPAMVGAFLGILPMLSIIGGLFGLYGIYLWYLGLGPIKKTPEDKKVVYIVVTVLVYIVAIFIIGAIVNMVLGTVFNIGGFNSLKNLR
jgi:Yip1 domain